MRLDHQAKFIYTKSMQFAKKIVQRALRMVQPSLRIVQRTLRQAIYALHLDLLAEKCGLSKRRIVAKIDGGLASQMWQFAIGYAVSKETGLPVSYETEFYEKDGCDVKGIPNRRFLLLSTFPKIADRYRNSFGEKPDSLFCKIFGDRYTQRQIYDYSPEIFTARSQYLQQYYGNAKYIASHLHDLKELFEFDIPLNEAERSLRREILSCPKACSVHVRRGDFVATPRDVCSDEYYLAAMQRMESKYPGTVFFIFSNDIDYCKKRYSSLPYSFRYIEGRNECDPRVDLYLLTLFKHAIIANSTFSWFPAFLNSDDQASYVVTPDIRRTDGLKENSRGAYTLTGWEQIFIP